MTSRDSDGVQVIDITNPKNPTPTSSIFYGQDGFDALYYPHNIAVSEIDDRTYALVTSLESDGVQVIDITNPKNPTPKSSIFDGQNGFNALDSPYGITVSEIDDRTYALVTSLYRDGVQVIDITNPKNPTLASSVFHGDVVVLDEDVTIKEDMPVSDMGDMVGGDVIVSYEEADDPIHYGLRTWLADNEDTIIDTDSIISYLTLHSDIRVVFESCGQANAWYSAASDQITMCYELADKYTTIFRESDIDTPYGVANALHWIFMHELGHAVIDMYDLPITGQEEDAADQFATIMLLREGTEGANALLAIVTVYAYSTDYTPSWDTHSFDSQRYYNMLCLLYGKHQDDDIGRYAEGLIPESRAIYCAEEYRDAANAWSILLDDYVHAQYD